MSVATEGKNAITEVKCQSVVSLQNCLDTYREAQHIYPLKNYVLKFLADAYLDIERKVEDTIEECTWAFLELISADIETYITVIDDIENEEFRMFTSVKMFTNGYKDNYLIKHLERFVYKGGLESLYNIFQVNLLKVKEHQELLLTLMQQIMTLYEIAKKQSYNKQALKVFKVIQRSSKLKKLALMKLGGKFEEVINLKKSPFDPNVSISSPLKKTNTFVSNAGLSMKEDELGIESKAQSLRKLLVELEQDTSFIES